MTDARSPRTQAGRALLGDVTLYGPNADEVRRVILAIEAEAAGGLREALERIRDMPAGFDLDTPSHMRSVARSALAASPSAAPLDVERLARAMARCAEVGPPAHHTPEQAEEHWKSYRMEAEEYAREYAAIAAAYAQEKPDPIITYTDPAGGPDWEPRRDEA